MSDLDIERFNAKYAGSYLGDSWVVRMSDYERLRSENKQIEARVKELEEALKEAIGWNWLSHAENNDIPEDVLIKVLGAINANSN